MLWYETLAFYYRKKRHKFIMILKRMWIALFMISLLISGQVAAASKFSCEVMPTTPMVVDIEVEPVSVDHAKHHNHHASKMTIQPVDNVGNICLCEDCQCAACDCTNLSVAVLPANTSAVSLAHSIQDVLIPDRLPIAHPFRRFRPPITFS